jgi:2-dehydropantoate 2-reductase
MRFVIYGAGGIGGVMGARLHQSGHEVVLIARGSHYEATLQRGLRLQSAEEDITLEIAVVDHPGRITIDAGDVVILGMKSQDTKPALDALVDVAPPDVAVACAQNGVANERMALRLFENVYGICVMCPTSYTEPGVVQAYSYPTTGILDTGRYPSGIDETTTVITDALSKSTFESTPRDDVMRWKYGKLLMNLGNGIDAICGAGARATDVYAQLRDEATTVLRAANIDFVDTDEDAARRGSLMKMSPIAGQRRGGGSTWQSLARGLPTVETDYLNGEIVLLGRLHGVPTPANAAMVRIMHRAAAERWEAGSVPAERLEELMYADVPHAR